MYSYQKIYSVLLQYFYFHLLSLHAGNEIAAKKETLKHAYDIHFVVVVAAAVESIKLSQNSVLECEPWTRSHSLFLHTAIFSPTSLDAAVSNCGLACFFLFFFISLLHYLLDIHRLSYNPRGHEQMLFWYFDLSQVFYDILIILITQSSLFWNTSPNC